MRKQRPRGSTTRDAVVSAALAVADRDGIERLSIRAVAACIAVPPMSLYTHFANKSELLDLMYAEIAQRMYAYQGHPTWQAELLELAQRVRRLLGEHPNWAPLLSRPVPPLAVALREQVLKLMISDGMSKADALMALSSVVLSTIGLVLVELTFKESGGASTLDKRFELLKQWSDTPPALQHSATRSALSEFKRFNFDDTFQFAVRALIVGFESRVVRAGSKQS